MYSIPQDNRGFKQITSGSQAAQVQFLLDQLLGIYRHMILSQKAKVKYFYQIDPDLGASDQLVTTYMVDIFALENLRVIRIDGDHDLLPGDLHSLPAAPPQLVEAANQGPQEDELYEGTESNFTDSQQTESQQTDSEGKASQQTESQESEDQDFDRETDSDQDTEGEETETQGSDSDQDTESDGTESSQETTSSQATVVQGNVVDSGSEMDWAQAFSVSSSEMDWNQTSFIESQLSLVGSEMDWTQDTYVDSQQSDVSMASISTTTSSRVSFGEHDEFRPVVVVSFIDRLLRGDLRLLQVQRQPRPQPSLQPQNQRKHERESDSEDEQQDPLKIPRTSSQSADVSIQRRAPMEQLRARQSSQPPQVRHMRENRVLDYVNSSRNANGLNSSSFASSSTNNGFSSVGPSSSPGFQRQVGHQDGERETYPRKRRAMVYTESQESC